MQPETHAESSAQSAIARARVGMGVVDAAGEDVGTVTAVQPPGTDVRPDLSSPDAEHMMAMGYLRVDGSGALAADVYVGGHQVTDVSDAIDGRVTVAVLRETLHRSM